MLNERLSWDGPRALALGLLILFALGPAALRGADEKKTLGLFAPWAATAEISYVVTGGNTETSAFSLGTTFSRKWAKDTLLFKSYILKSNATTTTRTAMGTEIDFEVFESSVTRKVAENYLFAGQYDRNITKRFTGQAGLSWDRNRFAGIDDRVIGTVGLGYAWIDKERTKVKTSAGLTYTLRQYVGLEWESFGGLRFTASLDQKLWETSSFASVFVLDENLKDSPDWRFDWTNSVAASISKGLALKVGLRTLYTHQPALQEIPLYDLGGEPTDLTVFVPLKKLDTFFTTSLVINF